MSIGEKKRALGIFPTLRYVEQALYELKDSGFPMEQVSIVSGDREYIDEMAGAQVQERFGNMADEGAALGATSGGAVGGLAGFLFSLGVLALPGIGSIFLSGAIATTIATTLAGAGIGAAAGGLLGALMGFGIPEDRARLYQQRLERGEYLVIVEGTEEEILKADSILAAQGIEDYEVYYPSAISNENVMDSVISNNEFDVTRHTVIGLPYLSDVEALLEDFIIHSFPLYKLSIVGEKVPQSPPFTGVAASDSFNAQAMSIPEAQAQRYRDRVKAGEYLVIISASERDMSQAISVLEMSGIRDWKVYDQTQILTTSSF